MSTVKKYTIVLQRPWELSEWMENENATDQYWAHVCATDYRIAIVEAKKQLIEVDHKDMKDIINVKRLFEPNEFTVLAVLDGHIIPRLWGWQAGVNE